MPDRLLRIVIVKPLGSGSSAGDTGQSTVFESLDVLSSTTVAIKFIPLKEETLKEPLPESLFPLLYAPQPCNKSIGTFPLSQMTLKSNIDFPLGNDPSLFSPVPDDFSFLIKSFGTSVVNTNTDSPILTFTTEKMDGGTLHQLFLSGNQADDAFEEILSRSAWKVLKGLESLHSLGIIHNDIKPSNILVGLDGQIKIADFGSCQLKVQEGSEEAFLDFEKYSGSVRYLSPERLSGLSHSYNSDIWSLGVMLNDLSLSHYCSTKSIKYVEEPPLSSFVDSTPNLNSFIETCCVFDHLFRSEASDLLLHPFLAKSGFAYKYKNFSERIKEFEELSSLTSQPSSTTSITTLPTP
jgi:serine/threonine protein kinase